MVYQEELQGVEETCFSWYEKNKLIYTFIEDADTGRVVGYINAMPVKEDLANRILEGKSADSEITVDDLLVYEDHNTYILYFCSIAVHPDYMNTTAFTVLYNAFMSSLIHLSERGIYITSVIADGVSSRGARLCRLCGLKPVLDTNHGSTIYCLSLMPDKFKAISYEGEKLKEIYERRFGYE